MFIPLVYALVLNEGLAVTDGEVSHGQILPPEAPIHFSLWPNSSDAERYSDQGWSSALVLHWPRELDPAVPGFKPPIKALCVVPQGMQEGSELLIEGRDFGLLTGHPAEFRFYSSAVRSGDQPGQVLPDAERELEQTASLEINLPPLPEFPAGQVVPVQINSVVTELGALELWMKHLSSDRRWKVEFQIRTE